ncbi:MAG: hydrogenase iron-sulfur subunit [Candidatus Eisenbacteria bacterium]|nr:hydrogenase iron-sulfur subunit [Candidatus Latescibacterota bacterium]MBD3302568.1 hydrogenase iron-sulfur subunit [Candidatus Eisenbacteria bacterium]
MSFEPKLVGFLCNWCSYTGADLAGTSRLKIPPNLRAIRVMCSGRVDPSFILTALSKGADGVLVLGCHPGDCHYSEGNYNCQRRLPITKSLVEQMGIDPRRVRLEWVSASEASLFQEVVSEFTEQIRSLGPLELKEFDFDRAAADAQLVHE